MKTLILIAAIAFSFAACDKPDKEANVIVPECISARIDTFKLNPPCPKGAAVYEYLFQNKTYYAFKDGDCCCDFGIQIVSETCENVCFLDGITGNQDCLGENFKEKAVLVQTIWEQ